MSVNNFLEQDVYEKLVIKAKELYNKKKYKEAIKLFKNILSIKYDPSIQYYLGKCHLYGYGTHKNYVKAINIFSSGVRHGYAFANYGIAKWHEIYEEQQIFPYLWLNKKLNNFHKFKNNVMNKFLEAAKAGHIESLFKAGQSFSYAPHYDFDKAIQYYSLAAERGHVYSAFCAGWLYLHGKSFNRRKDYVNAAKWFLKAAEQGSVQAMEYISRFYSRGKGVKKDKKKAVYWKKKAAVHNALKSKFRRLNIGDTIIDRKKKQEEIIVFICICDKNIQCGVSANENIYTNQFGSHKCADKMPCMNSKKCHLKIIDVKACAEKFYTNEWRFKNE